MYPTCFNNNNDNNTNNNDIEKYYVESGHGTKINTFNRNTRDKTNYNFLYRRLNHF